MIRPSKEPGRLLSGDDELSAELRGLVGAERGDPAPEVLARIASRVANGTGVPLAGAKPAATAGLTAGKLALVVGLGLAAACAALWSGAGESAFPTEPRHAPTSAAAPAPELALQAPPARPASEPQAPAPAPPAPLVAARDARPAVERQEHPPAAARVAPRRARRTLGQQPASSQPDPAAELKLLERAQRALRSHPRRALSLARAHAHRYPHGQFASEREMIAIEALMAVGESGPARRRASAFRNAYPGSPHLPRLAELLRRDPG